MVETGEQTLNSSLMTQYIIAVILLMAHNKRSLCHYLTHLLDFSELSAPSCGLHQKIFCSVVMEAEKFVHMANNLHFNFMFDMVTFVF